MVTLLSAWPGMIHTGPVTVRPWYFSSAMSPMLRPFCCEVLGLIQTALSQVILFWGLGSSCSHPLLANDPSQIMGSGRNMISMPVTDFACGAGGIFAVTFTAGSAVLATMPSLSDCCQKISKLGALDWLCQYSWTRSWSLFS